VSPLLFFLKTAHLAKGISLSLTPQEPSRVHGCRFDVHDCQICYPGFLAILCVRVFCFRFLFPRVRWHEPRTLCFLSTTVPALRLVVCSPPHLSPGSRLLQRVTLSPSGRSLGILSLLAFLPIQPTHASFISRCALSLPPNSRRCIETVFQQNSVPPRTFLPDSRGTSSLAHPLSG